MQNLECSTDTFKATVRKLLPLLDTAQIDNPCVESGCQGGCCRNMNFFNINKSELDLLTPKGVEVVKIPLNTFYRRPERDTFREDPYKEKGVTTVYVANINNDHAMVNIEGPCPNLNPDFSCAVYEERPNACRGFAIGSKDCNTIRKRNNIPEIITQEKKQSFIRSIFRK